MRTASGRDNRSTGPDLADVQTTATATESGGHRYRFDPFLLPHPSTSRLVLLVLSLAAGSMFASYWVFVLGQNSWPARNRGCLDRLTVGPDSAITAVAGFNACLDSVVRWQSVVTLLGPAALMATATLGWLLAPLLIAARNGLVPLPESAGAGPELKRLVAESGLPPRRRPSFLFVPDIHADDGWTFGRRGSYRIALGSELVVPGMSPVGGDTCREGGDASRQRALRAVVRHELGHLRNRDVDRTYLAMSAWYGFAALTVAEFALAAAGWAGRGWLAGPPSVTVALRLTAVAFLVHAAFAGYLRAREVDADLRAAADVQGRADLVDTLADPDDRPLGPFRGRAGTRAGWLSRHPRVLSRHPTMENRRKAVLHPERVMTFHPGETAGVGLAAGLGFAEVQRAIGGLVVGHPMLSSWLTGLLVGLPVTGVVGLAAWRSRQAWYAQHALAQHATAQHATPLRARRRARVWAPRTVSAGVALGTGLVVGNELSPRAAGDWPAVISTASTWFGSTTLGEVSPGTALLQAGVTIGGCVVVTAWIVAVADALGRRMTVRADEAGGHPAWSPPDLRQEAPTMLFVAVGALVLALPLALWFHSLHALSSGWTTSSLAWWVQRPLPRGLVVATIVLALAVPVAATAGGERRLRRAWAAVAAAAVAAGLLASAVLCPFAAAPAAPRPMSGVSGMSGLSGQRAVQDPLALPPSSQGFFVCAWLGATNGRPVIDALGDRQVRLALGSHLARTDDPAMRVIGAAYLGEVDLSGLAGTSLALLRLCDVERRYGRPVGIGPLPVGPRSGGP
ncbi:M48 family metalloprotease [Parafrankia elaeagni]|uniref:M48 family metalloprotease n=1 Tax=Parafrankia elaeagni TaxID=222534 RepID=UPI000377C624|nr:M48 family metalloprotease [Parafrankia elaeagni]